MPWLVCAVCGGAIGVYERCLVAVRGEPVEISWLSLAEDEREAARAKGAYHRACYSQAPQTGAVRDARGGDPSRAWVARGQRRRLIPPRPPSAKRWA